MAKTRTSWKPIKLSLRFRSRKYGCGTSVEAWGCAKRGKMSWGRIFYQRFVQFHIIQHTYYLCEDLMHGVPKLVSFTRQYGFPRSKWEEWHIARLEKSKLNYERISNPGTVLFGKILPVKNRCKDLKEDETGTMFKHTKNNWGLRDRKRDCGTSLNSGRRARRSLWLTQSRIQ